MLTKRIIPCLDVKDGRVVKGVKFQGLRDVGDPVALACRYEAEGADELVFLDITASHEDRQTTVAMVRAVAHELSIPFTVGGGVNALADAERLLEAGADKVSVNTAAVNNPQLINDIATHFGNQCCILAVDAQAVTPGQWQVLTHGGRTATGKDALTWAKMAVELGAGEILLTSWDADGTRGGFDLPLTRAFASTLPVPVIASGGARDADSFVAVFGPDGLADAALAASIFHDGDYTVKRLKQVLKAEGLAVRV